MKVIHKLYKTITTESWHLGFVCSGLDGVFSQGQFSINWVKSPYKDRWFADPFILDVTEENIYLLVEEFRYKHPKGRIAKLIVDRQSLVIKDLKIILEEETHLSFPNILRRAGKIYVYPENAMGGGQNIYEYDEVNESLVYVQTICDDVIWDACITEEFGKKQLFTAHKDDYHLDIYCWDETKNRFLPYESIESKEKNSRLGGQFFEYQGNIYCPFQNCTKTYGGYLELKQATLSDNGQLCFAKCMELSSPHRKYNEGLHTLNTYKGVVVIDVKGYNHFIGKMIVFTVSSIKRLLKYR